MELYALGSPNNSLLILNHLKFNNQKAYYDIVKNSTDFSLKLKDSYFVITNHRTKWTKRILEFAFPYLFFPLAFASDTTTKRVDTWEPLKPTPMLEDSFIGLGCLIGFVLLQLNVSLVKIINPNQNTETNFL